MGKAEYNTENSKPFTVDEMLGLFRNHEIVNFILPGIGMTEAETILFNDAIKELEANAQELDRRENGVKIVIRKGIVVCGRCYSCADGNIRYCDNCGIKLIWDSEV